MDSRLLVFLRDAFIASYEQEVPVTRNVMLAVPEQRKTYRPDPQSMTAEELVSQERELSDQLFKLKFQLNMGQTESLKKIRGLRRDIARVKTIARERELAAASATEKK